jgi:hypothetical protein
MILAQLHTEKQSKVKSTFACSCDTLWQSEYRAMHLSPGSYADLE